MDCVTTKVSTITRSIAIWRGGGQFLFFIYSSSFDTGAYNPGLEAPGWRTPPWLSRRPFRQVLQGDEVGHRQESGDLGKPGCNGDLEVVNHGPSGFCQTFPYMSSPRR